MGFLDRWAQRVSGPDGVYDGPPDQPRPLTAAGARVNLASPALVHTKRPAWQEDAWTYRDDVPEMRFAGEFVGFALGRLRVFGAENRGRGEDPIPIDTGTGQAATDTGVLPETRRAVTVALNRLNLNEDGASLLGRFGENLEYAGECYLLGEDTEDGESWSVRSVSEVQVTQGGARLTEPGTGAAQRLLTPDNCDLLRLWNPHPRFYEWPDSPVASLLGVLEGMVLINRRGRAHDRSRISSGKGLYVPTEFSMSTPGSDGPISASINGVNVEESQDPFMEHLTGFMTSAIRDETDPSAVVPLLIRGPAMLGDRPAKEVIGTFDLHGEDPQKLDERYESLVTRFARGINLSPERVKGLGETTHWNALSITADEVSTAIAPRATRMCDALTAAYLRPALKAMGIPAEQRAKVCVWYDASRLAEKPNRAEDAKAAHTAGTISDASLRRYLGFTDDDAPSNLEMLRRAVDRERLSPASVPILVKVLTGQMPTPADITALVAPVVPNSPAGIARPVIDHGTAAPPGRVTTSQAALPAGERSAPASAPAGLAAAATRKGPKDDPTGPSVAGVALIDSLTGRVLMLQRGLDDDDDPAAGTWEFPGGHVEPGDETSLHAGMREWAEEVGRPFPGADADTPTADATDTWVSPNGVYRGHIIVLPGAEDLVDLDGPRTVPNADDDYSEQSAWWDIDMARRMGPALRPEVKDGTPWAALRKAAREHAPTTAAAGRDQRGKFATPDHARRWRPDRATGKQLVAIDRELTTRVLAHSEATVGRIVEKLANRIRSDAQKNPATAGAFPKGSDPRAVVAATGPDIASNTSALVVDQLVGSALDELETLWFDEVRRAGNAVQAVLDSVIGELPAPLAAAATRPGRIGRAAAQIVANARDAWNRLRERLREHALNVLYGGYTPSRGGEQSPGIVPASIIRPAVAETGGIPTQPTGSEGLVPATGPGTGEIALDTLRVAGAAELGWEWVYPPAPRQHFPGHQRLDGVEFTSWTDPVLDAGADASWIGPFYSPGDHQGCFVAGTEVSGPPARASFVRPYTGEGIQIRTQTGKLLTGTPNHPILTPGGWVALGALAEGDEVVVASGEQGSLPINDEAQQVPALIEDVAAALPMADGVVTRPVPTSAEDFHGDGAGSHGEVTVVRADRRLFPDDQPPRPEIDRDDVLQLGGEALGALASGGIAEPLLPRDRATAGCGVGGPGDGLALLGRATDVASDLGVVTTASGDVVLAEDAGDDGPADPVGAGDGEFAGAVEVGPDDGRLVDSGLDAAGSSSGVVQDAFDEIDRDALVSGDLSQAGASSSGGDDGEFVDGAAAVGGGRPGLPEPALDDPSRYPVPAPEELEGYAGRVVADEVVEVSRVDLYATHVYNLSTTTGWYTANGVIVHNCLCFAEPYVAIPMVPDASLSDPELVDLAPKRAVIR